MAAVSGEEHHPLTAEQGAIVSAMTSRSCNVLVDAVAGAAKTYTALQACKRMPAGETVFILTYNAKLKMETKAKVERMGMADRVHVFSYHSACVRHYDEVDGCTDVGIMRAVETPLRPRQPFAFDLLIVDECQDMTPLYFGFVRRLLLDNRRPGATVAAFGDVRQCIYGFKGADPRLFRLLPDLLPFLHHPHWKRLGLSTSFRITRPMCEFVNRRLLVAPGDVHMRAVKDGPAVRYRVIAAPFADPFDAVMAELREGRRRAGDVFVLVASLRSSSPHSPLKVLENRLVRARVPCFVPTNDDVSITDDEVLRGKLVFSTFHQSKGLERPVAFVMGFDDSYTEFFNVAPANQTRCPNEIYVACTRASEKLVLLHSNERSHMPFMDVCGITEDPCVELTHPEHNRVYLSTSPDAVAAEEQDEPAARKAVDLSGLFKYRSSQELADAAREAGVRVLRLRGGGEARRRKRALPNVRRCPQSKTREYVGDLHRDAVMACIRRKTPATMDPEECGGKFAALPDAVRKRYVEVRDRWSSSSYSFCSAEDNSSSNISDVLFVCVVNDALRTGYIHRTAQITDYDWIRRADIERFRATLSQMCPGAARGKTDVHASMEIPGSDVEIRTRIPVVVAACGGEEQEQLWTFGFGRPSSEHVLQAACRACVRQKGAPSASGGACRMHVADLYTGEVVVVECDPVKTSKMMARMVTVGGAGGESSSSTDLLDDAEFVRRTTQGHAS